MRAKAEITAAARASTQPKSSFDDGLLGIPRQKPRPNAATVTGTGYRRRPVVLPYQFLFEHMLVAGGQ